MLRGEASWIERREGKKVRRDPAEALARLRDAARAEDVPEDPRDAFRRSWARKRRARGRRVLGEEEPSSRDAKNLRSAILEEIVRRRDEEIAALKAKLRAEAQTEPMATGLPCGAGPPIMLPSSHCDPIVPVVILPMLSIPSMLWSPQQARHALREPRAGVPLATRSRKLLRAR